jgi:hypothetical protein
MDNEARRSMLRSITDEQYDDIMNVLSIYPYVTMDVSCEVFDDEEVHKITTGAVVTLTIHLHRENMSTVFNKELGVNTVENETNEDQREDKENQEKVERFCFIIDRMILFLLNRLMKHLKELRRRQHRIHQKVGIINPIRRKKRKRKVQHQHQNQRIHRRLNHPQHLWLIKVKAKNLVVRIF